MERDARPLPSLPKFAKKLTELCEDPVANLGRVPEAGGVGLALPEFLGEPCDNSA
jgi:hypothetical protein